MIFNKNMPIDIGDNLFFILLIFFMIIFLLLIKIIEYDYKIKKKSEIFSLNMNSNQYKGKNGD